MGSPEPPQQAVQEAIETVRHEFTVSDPVIINSGYCRPFAEQVLDRLTDFSNPIRHDAWDVHTWIEVNGRHYDAETPSGVENPHCLPLWARLTAERKQTAAEASNVLSIEKLVE